MVARDGEGGMGSDCLMGVGDENGLEFDMGGDGIPL